MRSILLVAVAMVALGVAACGSDGGGGDKCDLKGKVTLFFDKAPGQSADCPEIGKVEIDGDDESDDSGECNVVEDEDNCSAQGYCYFEEYDTSVDMDMKLDGNKVSGTAEYEFPTRSGGTLTCKYTIYTLK